MPYFLQKVLRTIKNGLNWVLLVLFQWDASYFL